MTRSLLPGTVVLGDFEIIRPLGQEGLVRTYLAVQRDIGRPAVIKFPRVRLLEPEFEDEVRGRFASEIATAGGIRHPNLVTIYAAGEVGGIPAVAMEYVEGESLGAWLERAGRLEPKTAAVVTEQLVSVVAALHRIGLVHRDLSPESVIITDDDVGSPVVTLLDFGIAGFEAASSVAEGPFVSPAYVAPEVAGDGASEKSDIFALGGLLWWVWTGRPYLDEFSRTNDIYKHLAGQTEPPDPRRARPGLGGPIADVLSAMLHPEADSRPSAQQVVLAWNALSPASWDALSIDATSPEKTMSDDTKESNKDAKPKADGARILKNPKSRSIPDERRESPSKPGLTLRASDRSIRMKQPKKQRRPLRMVQSPPVGAGESAEASRDVDWPDPNEVAEMYAMQLEEESVDSTCYGMPNRSTTLDGYTVDSEVFFENRPETSDVEPAVGEQPERARAPLYADLDAGRGVPYLLEALDYHLFEDNGTYVTDICQRLVDFGEASNFSDVVRAARLLNSKYASGMSPEIWDIYDELCEAYRSHQTQQQFRRGS